MEDFGSLTILFENWQPLTCSPSGCGELCSEGDGSGASWPGSAMQLLLDHIKNTVFRFIPFHLN